MTVTTRFASLVLILFVWGCSFSVRPVAVGLPELFPCAGFDNSGQPIKSSDIFSPNETRIYVCGRLKTVEPVVLQFHWSHEGELIFVQEDRFGEGYFFAYMARHEGMFLEGNYEVEVLFMNTVLRSTEFRVAGP